MSAISVIIPCYNHEKYIHETIESVLSQTFDDYEIIIVNDGSTDNSLSIINSYAKKYPHKIRVIDQKNKGVVIARNNAISLAKADLIFPLDADEQLSVRRRDHQRHQLDALIGGESAATIFTLAAPANGGALLVLPGVDHSTLYAAAIGTPHPFITSYSIIHKK